MYKRILVPVDGSNTSKRGLKEAVQLARTHRARLRILHVADASVLAMTPEIGVVDYTESLNDAGRKILKTATALAARAGIKAENAMVENLSGQVAGVILNEARKWRADLVVMGTHGRRGFSHMLLGSTAEGVVRASAKPVLLVRGSASRATRSPGKAA